MDATTLAALKGSIQHWRENVEAKTPVQVKLGSCYCPLCELFNDNHDCRGCPVFEVSGEQYCAETPYSGAVFSQAAWVGNGDETSANRFRSAAQAELDFLISLLPEGETA